MGALKPKCSAQSRLPAVLMLVMIGGNMKTINGKSICNLCQPGYHERCQVPYPYPFLFLYGSNEMVTPLANGIAGAIAGLWHRNDISVCNYLCLSVSCLLLPFAVYIVCEIIVALALWQSSYRTFFLLIHMFAMHPQYNAKQIC